MSRSFLGKVVHWARGARSEDRTTRAISDFFKTFGFAKSVPETAQGLPASYPDLMVEVGWRLFAKGANDAIFRAEDGAWFKVSLNGVELYLPRFTLRVMRNCLFMQPDGSIKLVVEIGHWEEIKKQLGPNTLFIDVGAATGLMSVPYAMSMPHDVSILAFEPSPRTRRYLEQTVARNGAQGIEVSAAALSDTPGQFDFLELPLESSGHDTPWISEGSRLSVGEQSIYPGDHKVTVPVTTLDEVAASRDFAKFDKIVIKIDVEGFEDLVLTGGLRTLERYKPFLSIDIHAKPGTSVSAGPDVKRILAPLGYTIEERGHVFLCRVA